MPAEVDDLEHASQLVAKVAWGDEPGVAVGEAIEGMNRARNAADAALLLAVRSFSARGEHRAEGHASVAAWLQHTCGLKKRHASAPRPPGPVPGPPTLLEEAMADGRISFDHIESSPTCHRERFADAWTEAYPLLVDYATVARFEDVARHAQRFADVLSPTDADDRFEDQVNGRRFTKATSIDGFGYLRRSHRGPRRVLRDGRRHRRLTRCRGLPVPHRDDAPGRLRRRRRDHLLRPGPALLQPGPGRRPASQVPAGAVTPTAVAAPALLQADHIDEHADGGPTDCANGQCLCGFHNRWKSNHKHDPPRTAKQDTGARRARPPDLC